MAVLIVLAAVLALVLVSFLVAAVVARAGSRLARTPARRQLTAVPEQTPDPDLLHRAKTWGSW